MKKLVKILLCTALLWGLGSTLHAQSKHEFSIYGGGGLSTLFYDVTAGEHELGFGGLFGFGYNYFFTPKWSLGLGIEGALYNTTFNLPYLNASHMAVDMEGTNFEFRSAVRSYKEEQRAIMVQIPLMLQFQTGGVHKFYIAGGGKVGLPVSQTYKSNSALLQNSGYYEYEDYNYTTQEFLGLGDYLGRKSNDDLDLKLSFMVSGEAGMKWRLTPGISLYTGIYVDYGLNNITEDTKTPFVAYNSAEPRNFSTNSVIHSKYTPNMSFTDKVVPLAAGIKLRFAFTSVKKELPPPAPVVVPPPAPEPEPAPAPPPPPPPPPPAPKPVEKPVEKPVVPIAEIQKPIDNYAVSQTGVTPTQKEELDKRIALLKQYPDVDVFIYGHTCELGTDKVNEQVGLHRAQNAKIYMISKGISDKRIVGVASKRDSEPVVPNTSEANRRKNRRVVLIVQ